MKKIAVINDMSGFGRCSLTAALPVISTLGVQACPMPTAILSSQTGFPSYHCVDFTKHMHSFRNEWENMNVQFDGIYTGFVSSENQLDEIFTFINSFHSDETFLLVDPIMGDDGETYDIFTPILLEKMIKLTQYADIITPNLTELCLIANIDYASVSFNKDKETILSTITSIAHKIISNSAQKIIITGVRYTENNIDMIANVLVSAQESYNVAHPYLGGSYSGTGDLFASCISGGLAKGMDIKHMMDIASDFLYSAIKETSKHHTNFAEGVEFESHLYKLIQSTIE